VNELSSSVLYRLLIVLLCLLAAACASLPRDPESTLQRVQTGGRLRVGLVESPPWVVRTTGEPAGAEVELVRRFATELGATPEWYWGGEEQHMEALERFELDLVVGGLTDKTPWSRMVGLTRPYFEERVLVGVPGSMQPPEEIKGLQVAAKPGDAVAAYLKKKGATAVPTDDLSQAMGPAAAPDWKLEQMGFKPTTVELLKEAHVMAVPPGENGWLKRLSDFLSRQRSQVKALLQQEATARR
jgi:polar amino acid transport system substrate-binding protein